MKKSTIDLIMVVMIIIGSTIYFCGHTWIGGWLILSAIIFGMFKFQLARL